MEKDLIMKEKGFQTRAREMRKELRVMERRRDELIKKDKYDGLGKVEREELESLFRDIINQGSENIDELYKSNLKIL